MGRIKSFFRVFYIPLVKWLRLALIRIKYPLKICSSERTIRQIEEKNYSISRFGDGEFALIVANPKSIAFQGSSELLREKLIEVLKQKDKNLLVCIPRCMRTTRGMNRFARNYWEDWCLNQNKYKEIATLLKDNAGGDYHFGDAMITRPYIDWVSKKHAVLFYELKKIWNNKSLLIVEGEQTRLGIGNDLFAGAASIKRILAPSINAFDRYDEILQITLSNYHGELVLLALGPTATVLASDLSKHGIQALDVGHIDIEYMWYKMGTQKKVPIPGKYTNECWEGHVFSDCLEPEYLLQIVGRV